MAIALGKLETLFLAHAQTWDRRIVETGDLARNLGLTAEQERKVLSRLARKGFIARVRRGLYLIPPGLPPGGRWTPSDFLALSTLIDDRQGRYQISGPSTFYRYGWTEQVPNRLYAYNNRISGDRQVGSVAMTLIKVADSRLGGTEVLRAPSGIEIVYASRARSLMDAVYDWSRFNSLPHAYDWIRREIKSDGRLASQLIEASLQFGNQGTMRRIGVLLERAEVAEKLVRKLNKAIRPSTAFIPWVPDRGKRGTANKRWGVILNNE